MFSGMRAKGPKADLALVVADEPAVSAGVFTTNVMCAAPVTYCREVLAASDTARAVSNKFPSICDTNFATDRKSKARVFGSDLLTEAPAPE